MRLCREFHVLPSQLLAEDVELLRLIAIDARGNPPREEAEPYE